jgi:hypothetical protein
MKKNIFLGYEVKTGKKVEIPLAHLIVTGITNLSGKTTCIEALIKRSGLKAIIFKTKVGEAGINEGTIIPPYFKENSNWQYVQSLLEATLKERMKFERSWIIDACRNANSLLEVKANIDRFLADGKDARGRTLNALSRSIYTTLQAYFELILPQLQYSNFSKTLELRDGINIMDLERYKVEIQSLVMRSVLETVLNEQKGVIVVIPEFWKFCPQTRGSPVKMVAEEFIRQGATNQNFLWADSQDLANVDKTLLKQVSVWVLGLQQERNEVKHTLDQIPVSKSLKPKTEEIMTLDLGHFFVSTPDMVKKVYVLPAWLDEAKGKDIALGKLKVESIQKPSAIAPYSIMPLSQKQQEMPNFESQKVYAKTQQDMIELRQDFFNKQQQMQEQFNRIAEELYKIQTSKQEINIDEIVSKVLQKVQIPAQQNINKEQIISEVLARVPRMSGSVTYEVAPLEKIKKDFLNEAKNKIMSEISGLDDKQKKMLKWIEQKGTRSTKSELFGNCFGKSATGGQAYVNLGKQVLEMKSLELIKVEQQRIFPALKEKIAGIIQQYGATEQEIEQVYSHILMEMLV